MNVLILGAGGMIGNAIADFLHSRGDRVVRASRHPATHADHPGISARVDRADPDAVMALIKSHQIDALVDVIAYTERESAALLNRLDGRIDHYVMLSSADVYRQYGLLHRRENGPAAVGPLAEEAPLRRSHFPYRGEQPRAADDPNRWMDDYDKIPIEQLVRQMQSAATILRLPMVFGPEDAQRRFLWAIQPMLEGIASLSLPKAWLDWTTSYGFVGNMAAAVAITLDQPADHVRTYNILDFAPVTNRNWLEAIARLSDWSGDIESCDNPDHPMMQRLAALDLAMPLALDGTKLKQELGFDPPVSRDEALAMTIRWETDQLTL